MDTVYSELLILNRFTCSLKWNFLLLNQLSALWDLNEVHVLSVSLS